MGLKVDFEVEMFWNRVNGQRVIQVRVRVRTRERERVCVCVCVPCVFVCVHARVQT